MSPSSLGEFGQMVALLLAGIALALHFFLLRDQPFPSDPATGNDAPEITPSQRAPIPHGFGPLAALLGSALVSVALYHATR